jgi:hypothetical protein
MSPKRHEFVATDVKIIVFDGYKNRRARSLWVVRSESNHSCKETVYSRMTLI